MTGGGLGSAGLGLTSAVSWGSGDFAGGLASRRLPSSSVVLLSQTVGLVLVVALTLALREPLRSPADALWGAAAGVSGSIALIAFYRGLAQGRMGLVAPVSGTVGAVLPVVFGVLTQGTLPPLTFVGVGLAIVSVPLVSHVGDAGGGRPGLGLALMAGLGFGGFFIFIHQAGSAAIAWPMLGARLASVLASATVVVGSRAEWRPDRRTLPLLGIAGTLDLGGNVFFILAARSGALAVAAVLSSLYPLVTVVLARLFLGERVSRVHASGIAVALLAIALISVG